MGDKATSITGEDEPRSTRIIWPNGCDKTVPEALRFLANHDRPQGGEQLFNSAHLYQLAVEIEQAALATPPETAKPDMSAAAERIARIEAQMLQHGGVDSDDMEWMAQMTRAALPPETAKPATSAADGLREALDKIAAAIKGGMDACDDDSGTADLSVFREAFGALHAVTLALPSASAPAKPDTSAAGLSKEVAK